MKIKKLLILEAILSFLINKEACSHVKVLDHSKLKNTASSQTRTCLQHNLRSWGWKFMKILLYVYRGLMSKKVWPTWYEKNSCNFQTCFACFCCKRWKFLWKYHRFDILRNFTRLSDTFCLIYARAWNFMDKPIFCQKGSTYENMVDLERLDIVRISQEK